MVSFINKLEHSLKQYVIPDGDRAGEPFELFPYQKQFLRGAFKPGVFRASLSLGRGGGKTGLFSALAADSVHPEGVLSGKRTETILIASSFAQAKIGAEGAQYMLEDRGGLDRKEYAINMSNSLIQIQHRETGARLRCVGSDNRRAHGWRINLVIADEPGQYGPRGESLNSALVTSLGKRQGAKILYCGTRARHSDHWYERQLKLVDPALFNLVYACDKKAKPFIEKNWHKANPGLRFGLPYIDNLRAESLMPMFRRRALKAASNPGSSLACRASADRDMLVDPEVWEELLKQPTPDAKGRGVWGVDLGGASAMSAVSCCWNNGRLQGLGMFGNAQNLEERGIADGVENLYVRAEAAGELLISNSRIPNIPQLFRAAFSRFGPPSMIALDRFRIDELRDKLEEGDKMPDGGPGFDWRNVPLVARGQGFKDGSQAVRAWRDACTNLRLYPVPNLLLTSALAEAVTLCDEAGNEKLAKNSEGGRRLRAKDDIAAAALLAVEFGLQAAPKRGTFSVVIG